VSESGWKLPGSCGAVADGKAESLAHLGDVQFTGFSTLWVGSIRPTLPPSCSALKSTTSSRSRWKGNDRRCRRKARRLCPLHDGPDFVVRKQTSGNGRLKLRKRCCPWTNAKGGGTRPTDRLQGRAWQAALVFLRRASLSTQVCRRQSVRRRSCAALTRRRLMAKGGPTNWQRLRQRHKAGD
jgi:hypothetical protein